MCFDSSYMTELLSVARKRGLKDLSFCYSVDVMRDLFQRRVTVFLSVWNKLRSSLDTNGESPSFPALF